MITHEPKISAAERWKNLRQRRMDGEANWSRLIQAQKNWTTLAQALSPYFEERFEGDIPIRGDYYLERIDKKHRYGPELKRLQHIWLNESQGEPFFDWLSLNEHRIDPDVSLSGGVRYAAHQDRANFLVQVANNRISPFRGYTNEKMKELIERADHNLIFTMDKNDQIYVAPKFRYMVHHSSFLAGSPVKMAGTFEMDDNRTITKITNYSGHYSPNNDKVANFLNIMASKGMNLNMVALELSNNGAPQSWPFASVWLKQWLQSKQNANQ